MKKMGAIILILVVAIVGGLVLVRRLQIQAHRMHAIQEVRDEIKKHDRATEDHRGEYRSRLESCRLNDKLLDEKERYAGLTSGPAAESRLKANNFGKRCSYDLLDTVEEAWEKLNKLDRRDLEDKLEKLERTGEQ
jgi:hypothetical protein